MTKFYDLLLMLKTTEQIQINKTQEGFIYDCETGDSVFEFVYLSQLETYLKNR